MSTKENRNFQEIGWIESPFKKRFGTPRQGALTPSSRAFLHIFSNYRDGLDGLQDFSHVWILSFFHLSEPISKLKIRPPRLRGKKQGLFATRSPHRPNPIGMTAAKIEKIQGDGIWVSGVDLIDRTPIIDLKPYIPTYDCFTAKEPDWIRAHPQVEWEFTQSFEDSLSDLSLLDFEEKENLKSLIEECLAFDPRPLPYLKREKETYYLSLGDLDVEVLAEGAQFKILRVLMKPKKEPKKK